MNILFVADTHDGLYNEELEAIIEYINNNRIVLDGIISCGDVTSLDFYRLIASGLSNIPNYPIYGVLGNHDMWNTQKNYSVVDLSEKAKEIYGVTFTGLSGSVRYKNEDCPMMTQEESLERAEDIPDADIFITHDKPLFSEDIIKEDAHSGLKGIGKYIEEHKRCKLHIYGHMHEFSISKRKGCTSVCIYKWCLANINEQLEFSSLYSYLDYWNYNHFPGKIEWKINIVEPIPKPVKIKRFNLFGKNKKYC